MWGGEQESASVKAVAIVRVAKGLVGFLRVLVFGWPNGHVASLETARAGRSLARGLIGHLQDHLFKVTVGWLKSLVASPCSASLPVGRSDTLNLLNSPLGQIKPKHFYAWAISTLEGGQLDLGGKPVCLLKSLRILKGLNCSPPPPQCCL